MNDFLLKRYTLRLTLCLMAVSWLICLRGQTAAPLQYNISVQLDDQQHQLQGYWELEYTNTSPDTLYDFYIHLWPNAYQNRTTPLARQLLRSGNTLLHFAPDSSLGFITDLAFQIDQQTVPYSHPKDMPDVAYFRLPQALPPGQTFRMNTPFRLQIPASISRLGHVGESYQITQWFPKVAMYDTAGWHPMSYLSYGEYYAPFADFTISIRLPENYVVAATGVLQDSTEVAWLSRRQQSFSPARNDDSFPASAEKQKTLRFTARRVHDFAWFADKRFRVEQDTLQLTSGRVVDVAVYYPPTQSDLWQNALTYVKRATRFFSQKIGEYPYPQVSAVQAPFSEGGGMEYPMVTLIGWEDNAKDLDAVIAHEVAHNWFYGIIASNERRHAWMDEGLTSYYEKRYLQQYYTRLHSPPRPLLTDPLAAYVHQVRQGKQQIADQSSEKLSPDNYWLNAYDIPQRAFAQWEALVGAEQVDRAIQNYFQQWQFRHPQPQDLRRSLEETSGQDMAWLFDGYLGSTRQADYALQKTDQVSEISIENRGTIAAPFPLQFYLADSLVYEKWHLGFLGRKTFPLPTIPYDQVTIDGQLQTLEINRRNNYSRRPLRTRSLYLPNDPQSRGIYFVPLPLYNVYDGISASLLFWKGGYPQEPLQWLLAPTYGFRSRQLGGSAAFHWQHTPSQGLLRLWSIAGQGQAYHFFRLPEDDGLLAYQRQELSTQFHFRADPVGTHRSQLNLSVIRLGTETPVYDTEGNLQRLDQSIRWLPRMQFQLQNDRILTPFQWNTRLEYQAYTDVFRRSQRYLRLSTEFAGKWLYRPDRHFFYRLFFGFFPQHTGRQSGAILPGAFSLIPLGPYDYAHDHYYLGRSETDGFSAQQVGNWDGAFKTPIFPGQRLGRSNNYAWAINLAADLPFGPTWLPLRPYLDLGYADDASPLGSALRFQDQFHWNTGFSLECFDGHIGLYFPLAGSQMLMDRLAERPSYFSRIGFRLTIKDLLLSKISGKLP